jgi:hypothetical protein
MISILIFRLAIAVLLIIAVLLAIEPMDLRK